MSFHDIEKAYPRVCRGALWDLLLKWGCDSSLLRVIHRVHGGISQVFVLERGPREGCPSSPVLFNIYHAAVMLDFRSRRKEAASTGHILLTAVGVWSLEVCCCRLDYRLDCLLESSSWGLCSS